MDDAHPQAEFSHIMTEYHQVKGCEMIVNYLPCQCILTLTSKII